MIHQHHAKASRILDHVHPKDLLLSDAAKMIDIFTYIHIDHIFDGPVWVFRNSLTGKKMNERKRVPLLTCGVNGERRVLRWSLHAIDTRRTLLI